ncbi:MAG: hypothetical protein IH881_18695 [Myxococcales bacterium]|nr:hypothetical protein [Myxococcales bacterium]
MAQTSEQPQSGYLSGPITDSIFLIGSPLLAVLVFLGFSSVPILNHPLDTVDSVLSKTTLTDSFIHVIIFGHLFIVFFRTHANPDIFRLHKYRFTLVPLALFMLTYLSQIALAAVAVLAIWWDVYHSALQTFGIGRIYDMKRGNAPLVGRRLDYWLNLIIYVGPVLGGTTLMLHLAGADPILQNSPSVAQAFFTWRPDDATRSMMSWATVLIGIPFCLFYVGAYWRLAQRGYQVSYQKVALLTILAVVSIICWGFSPLGSGYFVMNFFHAIQYFFIVWFIEKKNITSLFGVGKLPAGSFVALALFMFVAMGYGVWTTVPVLQLDKHTMLCVMIVVSIMHFWYDGFVWSVRKGQVK